MITVAAMCRRTLMVLCVISAGGVAEAALLSVSGRTVVRVDRLLDGSLVESSAQELSFPSPGLSLPLISNVRLDTLGHASEVLSSGQGTAVLDDSRTSRPVIPLARNDIGLDLAAFSSDERTAFDIEGVSSQTRRVQFRPGEIRFPTLGPARIRSNVAVAGALIVAATDPLIDLTGLDVSILIEVEQTRGSGERTTVLSASAKLMGGPNGQLQFVGTGPITPAGFPIINLVQLAPALSEFGVPYARAVVFPANIFTYDYDALANEEMDLTARFTGRLKTIPADVAAAAIFGLPQAGLSEVMSRVRHDDAGTQVQQAVSSVVDTVAQPRPRLPALCGLFGAELAVPLLSVGGVMARRARRRGRAEDRAGA